MYLLRGFVGYLAVLLVVAAFAHVGAQLAARWVGAAPFRWFDGRVAAVAKWRRFVVRAASSVAPFAAAIALLFFALLAQGDVSSTTKVDVLPGPAQAAGLRDGDRILDVDSKSVATFDEIRAEIGRGPGEKRLTIERGQRNFVVAVTPVDGRIGVTPTYVRRPLGAGEALGRALAMPLTIGALYLKSAFTTHAERTELMGPVAVVRATEKQRGQGDFLYMLALIAVLLSPFVAALHVFDGLTLALFRLTHSWSENADLEPLSARLARIHQTLWVSLICLLLLVVLQGIQLTSFGDAALAGIYLLLPAATACILLVGIATFLRFGRWAGLAATLASCFIPCAVLAFAAWVMNWLRGELLRRGLRVRGLVAGREDARA